MKLNPLVLGAEGTWQEPLALCVQMSCHKGGAGFGSVRESPQQTSMACAMVQKRHSRVLWFSVVSSSNTPWSDGGGMKRDSTT